MSGLGIQIAAWIAPASFVSWIGSSWSLQKGSPPRSGFEYLRNYLSSLGVSVPVLPSKNNLVNPLNHLKSGYSQANLMLELNKLRLSELQVNLPKRTQTLITGHSCKAANFWMKSCPSSFYRTTFTPSIFRVLLKFHLGIPILAYPQPCPDCHKSMDTEIMLWYARYLQIALTIMIPSLSSFSRILKKPKAGKELIRPPKRFWTIYY